MPDVSRSTAGAEAVRVRRERAGEPEIEDGWTLIRIEPESGNVVCEREEKRIVCRRDEFEKLNFPGSDDVWCFVADPNENDLKNARQNWAKLDLFAAASALLRHARTLDPAFAGIQTIGDLDKKINEINDVCRRGMDVLRLEIKRAKNEYDRFNAQNPLETDKKDSLLSRLRDLEDRYATCAYRHATLLPAWQRLCSGLAQLEATAKTKTAG